MARADLIPVDVPILEVRQSALAGLAIALSMLGEAETNALMKLSDAELGHSFKAQLALTVHVAQTIKLNLREPVSARSERRAIEPSVFAGLEPLVEAEWAQMVDKDAILASREGLVRTKKLVTSAAMWTGLGMTKQALSKAVISRRIFTVDVGITSYYPAFYLDTEIDRKELGKVTQALGSLPGWSKWQFFTTPSNFLGKMTPLKALTLGKVDDVKQAAVGFAER